MAPIKSPRKEKGMTIKQDLKAVQNKFKELGKNIEKLVKAIEKSEKVPVKKVATKTMKSTRAIIPRFR